jgi:hypothetical protein
MLQFYGHIPNKIEMNSDSKGLKQKVLGRTNSLLSFGKPRTVWKTRNLGGGGTYTQQYNLISLLINIWGDTQTGSEVIFISSINFKSLKNLGDKQTQDGYTDRQQGDLISFILLLFFFKIRNEG